LKNFYIKDDIALNHAACKTIENLLLVADKQADKLATPDIALALWNISSTVGNNENLRASALAVNRIVGFILRSYGVLFRHYVIWVYPIQMLFNQSLIK
jgi:hypothetical protein